MISHNDFVRRFAEVTGWDEADLRHRHRWLREDKQFKGGRGGRGGAGAAHADAEMALRLLLAMGLTARATEAPAAVRLAWNWRAQIEIEDQHAVWATDYPKAPPGRGHRIGLVPNDAVPIADELRSILLPLDQEHPLHGIWPGERPDQSEPWVEEAIGSRLGDVLSALLASARTEAGRELLRDYLGRMSFSRRRRTFTIELYDRDRPLRKRGVDSLPYRKPIAVRFNWAPDQPYSDRERMHLELDAGWAEGDHTNDLPAPIMLDVNYPRNIFIVLANLISPEHPIGYDGVHRNRTG